MLACRLLCGLLAGFLLGGCTRQPVGTGDGGAEDVQADGQRLVLDLAAPPPRDVPAPRPLDLTPPGSADLRPPPDTVVPPADSASPPADLGDDQGYIPWYCPPGVKQCLTNNDCPEGYYCITGCCKLTIGSTWLPDIGP